VDVNAAACQMFGYTKAELLELSVTNMVRDPTDIEARWHKHFSELRQSRALKFETAYHAKSGVLISVEVIANYVQFDGREYSCAFVRDITGRKRNAVALLAAKAEAEKANHAKSRFLAAASHDLRQPLSALSLYVGVLKSRVAPENKDLMARIEACCDSLTQLLSDLLDVSKLDAGVITPKLSDFAVDEFLKPLTTVHAAEANLKGLRLRLHPSGGLVARTDSGLLARVVNNLIANAIRYTHTGGVLVACRRRAGALWIEVWDTGMGIPENMREAIFDEFTQLGDDARNRGSGLGLAIVAKTASVLGLKIHLRSRVGRGSMFAVELPIGRINLPAEAQALQTHVRPLRIGLVEDNPDVRQALVLALENFGHQVVAAANGSALLKHMGDQAPDIVISDYRLGAGETGFHVIERVRTSFTADLPAIIITGDTDPAVIRSMTDRGIALHFKPLHLESLMAFITQATERRTR
jgi:PAS domain S-box-containing protein